MSTMQQLQIYLFKSYVKGTKPLDPKRTTPKYSKNESQDFLYTLSEVDRKP